MFEKRIRHIQRYREIAAAFTRNGFGFIAKELGLYDILTLPKRLFVKDSEDVHTKTTGERVRVFLEELGPTFVKLGQLASTRPDVIPKSIIVELEKLQDQVSAVSYHEVTTIVEQELGMEVDQVFREFEPEPLGAASIGQVHQAVLKTGEHVAVKVQRPNIDKRIKTDLEILLQLVLMAEHRMEWVARYKVRDMIEEFSNTILAELDYTVEGQNAEKIARQFADDATIRIPSVYWELSTNKVLTMEYVKGNKLNELEQLGQQGFDRKQLAERLTHAMLQQILMEGFFHGDPHPGNITVLPNETIVFIDFGMVGRLTPEMRNHLVSLVIALMRQDSERMIKVITKMGIVPVDVDMRRLRIDVDQVRERYYDIPLSKVRIGEAVHDLFSIAQRHQIQIPSDFTLLGKALLTLEGSVEKLDPGFNMMQVAEPFGRKLLQQRYHPKKVAKDMVDQWVEVGEALADVPKNIRELTTILKKGKVPLEISMPKLEMFLTKLDRISNRLSFSIVLLSFSIVMVGLIIGSAIGGQSSLLWDIPAVEIGFVVATLMFLWLIFSIFRSGRF
ncbi:ABC1 kinase family protein [Aquibacillus sediminis]|uniref:ABC1 kinase family protein n=1 Tax=Aquibacillus sediminis TaxID=2574734 RepID=UPI001107CB8E|nr:AarF/ABC1/UbiB kinase family protein [Aquibacillus sediminis]